MVVGFNTYLILSRILLFRLFTHTYALSKPRCGLKLFATTVCHDHTIRDFTAFWCAGPDFYRQPYDLKTTWWRKLVSL